VPLSRKPLLASISLFLGMLAVWAQVFARCDGAPGGRWVRVCGGTVSPAFASLGRGQRCTAPGTRIWGAASEEPVNRAVPAACRWWTGAAGMRTITPGFARQP